MVQNELFNQVIGPEKQNRVHRYEIGAKWANILLIVIQKSGVTHRIKILSEFYEAHREASEKQEAILA